MPHERAVDLTCLARFGALINYDMQYQYGCRRRPLFRVRAIRDCALSNVVTIIIIIILQISISVRNTERSFVSEGHFRHSAA